MTTIHHRTATVRGRSVFYREAGSESDPTIVLLHGFPTSSFMFRNLIPLLADKYHVIAPDHVGFGLTDAPSVDEFDYTFDALADVTSDLLTQLGVDRYAMYVQDYGAPIGWRLALANPEAVTAIISQNGNAYDAGFVRAFWDGLFAYAEDPSEATEPGVRAALSLESTKWQYLNGVADPSVVSPDTWAHDQPLLDRPGNDLVQLALFRDYPKNVALYPEVHKYFRDSQVPLLAVWGAGDGIFGPAGAEAFLTDLPDAEVNLVPSGHFALESHLDAIAGYIRGFLGRLELR